MQRAGCEGIYVLAVVRSSLVTDRLVVLPLRLGKGCAGGKIRQYDGHAGPAALRHAFCQAHACPHTGNVHLLSVCGSCCNQAWQDQALCIIVEGDVAPALSQTQAKCSLQAAFMLRQRATTERQPTENGCRLARGAWMCSTHPRRASSCAISNRATGHGGRPHRHVLCASIAGATA